MRSGCGGVSHTTEIKSVVASVSCGSASFARAQAHETGSLLIASPKERKISGPPKGHDVPCGQSEPQGNRENDEVGGKPHGEHGSLIRHEVADVIAQSGDQYFVGGCRLALDCLFNDVECRVVHKGQVDKAIEEYLFERRGEPRAIPQFFSQRQPASAQRRRSHCFATPSALSKSVHASKPLAKHVHLEPILEAACIPPLALTITRDLIRPR